MAPKRKSGSRASKKKAMAEEPLSETEASPSDEDEAVEAVKADDKQKQGKVEKKKHAKETPPSSKNKAAAAEEQEEVKIGDKLEKGSKVAKKKSAEKNAGSADDVKQPDDAKDDKDKINAQKGALKEINVKAENEGKGTDKQTSKTAKFEKNRKEETAAVVELEDTKAEEVNGKQRYSKKAKVEKKTAPAKAGKEAIVEDKQPPQKSESDKKKNGKPRKPPASKKKKNVDDANIEADEHEEESEEHEKQPPQKAESEKKKKGGRPGKPSKKNNIDDVNEEAEEPNKEPEKKKKRGRKPKESPASMKKAAKMANEEDEGHDEESEEHDNKEPDKKKTRGRKPKESPASKNKKADVGNEEAGEHDEESEDEKLQAAAAKNIIIIEASKECNSFNTRAAKMQEDLSKALPGVEVLVNPEKPRKGCFEIRNKEGDVYVSLLDMLRPFTKLKNLDLNKTVEEIKARIK